MPKSRFLLFAVLVFWAQVELRAEEAYTVCATCEFKTIKTAIEAASPHTTITVQAGMYKEGEITIAKPLALMGQDGAVIDGDLQAQPLTIVKTDGVVIKGFTIQNTGSSYVRELAGVRVIESKNCRIEKNKILNATYGVYLENSTDVLVSENEITGAAKDESSGGNGIHIWYGRRHMIEKNHISGHRDGIYLEFSESTQVKDNSVDRCLRYGLHFMSSSKTEYHRNSFFNNGAGVAVMYSRDIKMYKNRFYANKGSASFGLLMKEVHSSEIFENEIYDNTVGMFLEGSNRSRFYSNKIATNGTALRIMGDCENNEFSKNDFVGNSFDVTTNADHSWNSFRENYWSHYEGYDLDKNNRGDIPYRPVALSSILLERFDSSFVLINSFLFKLLDAVEKALPTLVPEPLKDEAPGMQPFTVGVAND